MWENCGFNCSWVVFISMNLSLLGYDICNYMYLLVYIWLLGSEYWLVAENVGKMYFFKALYLSFFFGLDSFQ
jgi:hypothetical protein